MQEVKRRLVETGSVREKYGQKEDLAGWAELEMGISQCAPAGRAEERVYLLVVWRHFPAVADSSEILECNNNDDDHTNDDEDEGDERENLHRVGCKLANHWEQWGNSTDIIDEGIQRAGKIIQLVCNEVDGCSAENKAGQEGHQVDWPWLALLKDGHGNLNKLKVGLKNSKGSTPKRSLVVFLRCSHSWRIYCSDNRGYDKQ